MFRKVITTLFSLILLLSLHLSFSQPLKKVSIELKWFHQFQFAGIYAAKEKGFYQDEGLDVTIVPRDLKSSPIKDVLSGKVQFGVSDASIVRDRLMGKSVVVLAAIFQHSPLVLVALEKSGIISPIELKGKRVMYQGDVDDAIIMAMLHENGIERTDFTYVSHNFNDDSLLDGSVDAISAYITNQPYLYKERGEKINLIKQQSYGIDFYGDMIFTSEAFFNKHHDEAMAFRKATIRGWKYALAHPVEIIKLIQSKYGTAKSFNALKYEADLTRRMIAPEQLDIGHISKNRLEHIADIYQRSEGFHPTQNIEGLYYKDHEFSLERHKEWILFGVIVLGILVFVVLVLLYFTVRLKHTVQLRTAEIEGLLRTDHLTGLFNRRHIEESIRTEIKGSERYQRPLSIMMMDVDRFKQVNDELGHLFGDEVLKNIAQVMSKNTRETDLVGRWGGEEFLIVCPSCAIKEAQALAEKLRVAVEALQFETDLKVTVSIGVSQLETEDTLETLSKRADEAMYQAKSSGRNKVCVG